MACRRAPRFAPASQAAPVCAEVGPGEGPVVQVRLDLNGETLLARVTRHSAGLLGLTPGRAVHAVIKSVAIESPGRFAVEPGDDAEIEA